VDTSTFTVFQHIFANHRVAQINATNLHDSRTEIVCQDHCSLPIITVPGKVVCLGRKNKGRKGMLVVTKIPLLRIWPFTCAGKM